MNRTSNDNEDYYLQLQRNGGQVDYSLPPNYPPPPNPYSPQANYQPSGNPYLPPAAIGGQVGYPLPQYSRAAASPFNAIVLGVSLLLTLAAGGALAYYTSIWWFIIIFPLLGMSGGLRGGRGSGSSAAYIGSRLVALLITLAIFAGVFITILCKLNGVF